MKTLKGFNFNLWVISFFVLILVFIIGRAASAATYYVSPMGNDNNDGSMNTPFQTIQKAANVVNPGDTVIVGNGTYTGGSTLVTINRSGSSGSPITFKSENKWGAVLDGVTVSALKTGFLLYGSYIIIQDFEIKNVGTGIDVWGVNHITIYRNKIHDVARMQIPCTMGNQFVNGKTAIYANSTSSYITIDSNLIYNIGRLPGGATTCNDSAMCAQYSKTAPCNLSWIDYSNDHGIYMQGSHSTMTNNIFYETKAGYSIQLDSNSYADIINNTFYGTNTGTDGHIVVWMAVTHLKVQNNISHSPRNYFIRDDYNYASDVTYTNNLIYNALLVGNNKCSATGYTCSNNITGQDPLFVDLANYDFHLQAGSPAIDAGISAFPVRTKDADGNAIVGAPDIGAYEYVGSSTPPPADTIPPAPPKVIGIQ
jgi:hypothetical protein